MSERLDEYTRTRPVFTVDLDAGVFNWLNEIILAKQRAMPPSRPSEYVDLVKRAAVAFQASYDAKEAAITAATAPPAPTRKIKRRDPEPVPQRRGVKRRGA